MYRIALFRCADFYLKHSKFERSTPDRSDKGDVAHHETRLKKDTNRYGMMGVSRAQLRRFAVTLAARRYRKRITLAFKRHVITFRRINGIWSIFNFLWQTHTHTHTYNEIEHRYEYMRYSRRRSRGSQPPIKDNDAKCCTLFPAKSDVACKRHKREDTLTISSYWIKVLVQLRTISGYEYSYYHYQFFV